MTTRAARWGRSRGIRRGLDRRCAAIVVAWVVVFGSRRERHLLMFGALTCEPGWPASLLCGSRNAKRSRSIKPRVTGE